jgi:hypothetical protein
MEKDRQQDQQDRQDQTSSFIPTVCKTQPHGEKFDGKKTDNKINKIDNKIKQVNSSSQQCVHGAKFDEKRPTTRSTST